MRPSILEGRRITIRAFLNFSIHEVGIHGETYLITCLEYTSYNFGDDMKKTADDPETQRCWKQTDPCLNPLPQAARASRIWADTQEVLYLQ